VHCRTELQNARIHRRETPARRFEAASCLHRAFMSSDRFAVHGCVGLRLSKWREVAMSPNAKNRFSFVPGRRSRQSRSPSQMMPLIMVPRRNTVLFPSVVPRSPSPAKSIAPRKQALRRQRPIGIFLQRNPTSTIPFRGSYASVRRQYRALHHRTG